MRLLDLLFPERRNSAVIARDRLKIVLAHERASRNAPDFLPALQKELLEVVGHYVEIRDDMLRVNVGKSGDTSLLEINVEIDGAKVKPVKNGAAAAPAKTPPAVRPPPVRLDPDMPTPWVKPS
jgi:cell division topological specificity factor